MYLNYFSIWCICTDMFCVIANVCYRNDDPHVFMRKSEGKKRKVEIGYSKAELFPTCLNLKISILYIDTKTFRICKNRLSNKWNNLMSLAKAGDMLRDDLIRTALTGSKYSKNIILIFIRTNLEHCKFLYLQTKRLANSYSYFLFKKGILNHIKHPEFMDVPKFVC